MWRSWSIWRIAGAVLTVALLCFGLAMLRAGVRYARDFEEWKTAKPIDLPVDFSAPGEFRAPFHQTCSKAHGQSILLRVDPKQTSGRAPSELLAGLQAAIQIMDGTNLMDEAEAKHVESEGDKEGIHRIFSVYPFRKGNYQARIIVTEGAAALAGIPQRLEGRYDLCGMEEVPAVIGKVLGTGGSGRRWAGWFLRLFSTAEARFTAAVKRCPNAPGAFVFSVKTSDVREHSLFSD